jgi:hypothetical protein
MASIKITIDAGALGRFASLLRSLDAKRVFQSAVNASLPGVLTDIVAAAGSVLTASSAVINNSISILAASDDRPTASVSVSGAALPLSVFPHRRTPQGVEVQVKQSRALSVIRGAFLAPSRYFNRTGVFWRKWHDTQPSPKKNIAYGRLPAMYRLPIKELFSSSVADVVSDEPVWSDLQSKINVRLDKLLRDAIDAELKGL